MKTSYTYTVLQYVHDAVSGEGVNVGVVVYAKSLPYVKAKMSMRYGRVSEFFGGIDGDALLSSLRATGSGILEAKNKLSDTLPFIERPPSVRAITDAIIPPDDSALRFSEARPGVTEDLDEALEQLFARYVLRYDKSLRRQSRSDEEIKTLVRQEIVGRDLLTKVRPRTVRSENYEYEFPFAWKNGRWNIAEGVSFDLVNATNIVDKATLWMGRMHALYNPNDPFKVYFVLGEPRSENRKEALVKAQNILNTIPCAHELVREHEAGAFADFIRDEIVAHEEGSTE